MTESLPKPDPPAPPLPPRPERPEDAPGAGRGKRQSGSSLWGVLLVVMSAMFLLGGVVLLTMGAFGGVIALGLAVFLFAAVHYLVWGWWLGAAIHRDVAREQEQRIAERDAPDR